MARLVHDIAIGRRYRAQKEYDSDWVVERVDPIGNDAQVLLRSPRHPTESRTVLAGDLADPNRYVPVWTLT